MVFPFSPPSVRGVVGCGMPISSYQILVDGQPIQTNGASSVYFVSADADLSTKPIPHTICQSSRSIAINPSTVHASHEGFGNFSGRSQDNIGVLGGMCIDMSYCRF